MCVSVCLSVNLPAYCFMSLPIYHDYTNHFFLFLLSISYPLRCSLLYSVLSTAPLFAYITLYPPYIRRRRSEIVSTALPSTRPASYTTISTLIRRPLTYTNNYILSFDLSLSTCMPLRILSIYRFLPTLPSTRDALLLSLCVSIRCLIYYANGGPIFFAATPTYSRLSTLFPNGSSVS